MHPLLKKILDPPLAKVNKSGHVKKLTVTTNNRIQAGFNSVRRRRAKVTGHKINSQIECTIMHQSIPPAPRPPRADPRELAFFFALDGKFPVVGTLELANPPGWGRKKRANAPSSVNSATFFIDYTVQ